MTTSHLKNLIVDNCLQLLNSNWMSGIVSSLSHHPPVIQRSGLRWQYRTIRLTLSSKDWIARRCCTAQICSYANSQNIYNIKKKPIRRSNEKTLFLQPDRFLCHKHLRFSRLVVLLTKLQTSISTLISIKVLNNISITFFRFICELFCVISPMNSWHHRTLY